MTTIDSAQDYPIVALSLQTSGIHPSTSHIVRIDARTCTATGEPGHHYQWLVNPQENPGPVHLHGATKSDISQAPRFASILKQLDFLIDGRTLIVHNAPRMWGFIVADARRAMNQVARMNRNRNRGRKRSVGKIPEPVEIIDTLASWRRQGHFDHDTRIRAVAASLGCADSGTATANTARAQQEASSVAAEESALLVAIYHRLLPEVVRIDPDELQADPFGLQRHHARVAAMTRTPEYPNPGIYTPESGLVYGMEIAIAPEILMDATELIIQLEQANLTYAEKVTRTASLLVCNKPDDFVGKAMHAHRKGIPISTDTQFLEALDTVRAPSAEELEAAADLGRIARVRTPKIVPKKKRKPAKSVANKRAGSGNKASDSNTQSTAKKSAHKRRSPQGTGNATAGGGKQQNNAPQNSRGKAAQRRRKRAKQNPAMPTAKTTAGQKGGSRNASASTGGQKAQVNNQSGGARNNRKRRRRRYNSGNKPAGGTA